MPREIRDDQHGTRTNYAYGCLCEECVEANRKYSLSWQRRNREKVAAVNKRWRERNPQHSREYQRAVKANDRDYFRARQDEYRNRLAAEAMLTATNKQKRWEPHEDALLVRIPSNIAAASALNRTYWAIEARRRTLRAKGLLT